MIHVNTVRVGIVLVLASVCSIAQEWAYLYEKGGFKAFERKGHPVAYRAEGKVDLSLAEVAAVLVDCKRHHEWVNRLVESRLLEGDPLSRSVIYSRYGLPWPAKDRDAVMESVVQESPKAGEVRVRFRNVQHEDAPVSDKCIRVPICDGDFLLKDLGGQSVWVCYTIRLDPGGWLPDWVVRLFVRDAPYSTLRSFQSQVQKTRGQYAGFIAEQTLRWNQRKALDESSRSR